MPYDTDRFREEQRRQRVFRDSDNAKALTTTAGWRDIEAWVTEQVDGELTALERGVASWDEYQRSVGRLEAFRKVLGRPAELIRDAEREYDTGE